MPQNCPKCKESPGSYYFVIWAVYGECFRCNGTGRIDLAAEKISAQAAREAARVRELIFAEVSRRPDADRFDFATETAPLRLRVRHGLDDLVAQEPQRMAALVASVDCGRVGAVVDALATYRP